MTSHITDSRSAPHPVVPAEQWLAQRMALLAREKELTQLYEKVAVEGRALPWPRVAKDFVSVPAAGPRGLAGLSAGSDERRGGDGWGRTCRSRGSAEH